MRGILWIAFMAVLFVVCYLFLVPTAIMFLWDNLIVAHNADIAHMPYVIAVGVMVLLAMILKVQFLNLRVNTD